MLSLLWMAALAPLAHADCGDFAALVEAAETAVIENRTDTAAATLSQAEAALGCGPVPSPELLGRMWLAEGTRAYMQGDEKVSRLAFAAASRVAPQLWVDSYGPQVRKIYQAAAAHESAAGSIRIHPNPEGWSTTLDGTAVRFPVDAPSGLHLVQVGRNAQQTDYAEIFFLPAGDTYFILTGLEDTAITSVAAAEPAEEPAIEPVQEPVAQVEPAEPGEPLEAQPIPAPSGPGFDSPVFLVVGGAAAAVAGGSALLAMSQNGAMQDAGALEPLDSAYARQKTFGYTSYGAMGVAALCVGLHVGLSF
jgi:hypothetical protein